MFCAAARHSFLVSYSFLYELLCKNKHIMCQCVWLYRRLLLWADSAFVTETILGVNLMACKSRVSIIVIVLQSTCVVNCHSHSENNKTGEGIHFSAVNKPCLRLLWDRSLTTHLLVLNAMSSPVSSVHSRRWLKRRRRDFRQHGSGDHVTSAVDPIGRRNKMFVVPSNRSVRAVFTRRREK